MQKTASTLSIIDQISQTIRKRRSIQPPFFSGEIVTKEEVSLLLENAHWAPNHGHTEPWFFKVFSGDALKRFGKEQAELYKINTSPEDFKQAKFDKLEQRPTRCSHLIAICMKGGTNFKIPEIEEIQAVACAVQNLHLTATALGLAGYWSSGGMTYHEGMKDLLELGEKDKCLGFFHLGRPKEGYLPEGRRKSEWEDKVEWIEE